MQLLDCNIRCWECSEECVFKKTFYLPEYLFNQIILDSMKASAGYFMTIHPVSKEEAEKAVQIVCVSLKLAREQYLKKQSDT